MDSLNCQYCGKKFARKDGARNHEREVCHENPLKDLRIRTKCKYCGKKFARKDAARAHERDSCQKSPFKHLRIRPVCQFCFTSFFNEKRLRVHLQNREDNGGECPGTLKPLPTSPIRCPTCLKSFTRNSSLKVHLSNKTCSETTASPPSRTVRIVESTSGPVAVPVVSIVDPNMNNPENVQQPPRRRKEPQLRHIPVDPVTGKLIYSCQYCDIILETAQKRYDHERAKHLAKPGDGGNNNGTSFYCTPCKRYFASASSYNRHVVCHSDENFRPQPEANSLVPRQKRGDFISEDGQNLIFKCDVCGVILANGASVRRHKLYMHAVVKEPSQLDASLTHQKDPIKNMKLDPSNLGKDIEKDMTLYFSWIKDYAAAQVLASQDVPDYFVYSAAVLRTRRVLDTGMEQLEFIKKYPNSIDIYIGSCSSHKNREIGIRHFDMWQTSPLAAAHNLGYTILSLEKIYFKGKWLAKAKEMKAAEALNILQLHVNDEYARIDGYPQYRILNRQKELKALQDYDEEEIKQSIRKGVKGFRIICLEDECNGNCGARFHPDWNKDISVDLDKGRGKGRTPQQIDYPLIEEQPPKKPRISSSDLVDRAVEKKLKSIKLHNSEFDPTHHVYSVMTVSHAEGSPQQICQKIMDKKLTAGVYFGVNRANSARDHFAAFLDTGLSKELKKDTIRGFQIHVQKFDTRMEARKEEALRILHSLIHSAVTKNASFNSLNVNMEWAHLSLCDDSKLNSAIKMGLLGISPVNLGEVVNIPSWNQKYPVKLREQMEKNRVKNY